MQWSATCLLLAVITHGGGGVAKKGIEQFWTDDYKVFEQIYGRTSDKEIYGDVLPAPVTFNRHHDTSQEASQKKEKVYLSYSPDPDALDVYNIGNQYGNILQQHSMQLLNNKPATSTANFVRYSNYQPISHESDPETYNYLKDLEEFSQENYRSAKPGYKSYLNYDVTNPDGTNTYKSIQDILYAQDEGNRYTEDEIDVKYLKHPKNKNKKKKPQRVNNEVGKSRCVGSCRKRTAGSANYQTRKRPYRRSPTLKTVVVM